MGDKVAVLASLTFGPIIRGYTLEILCGIHFYRSLGVWVYHRSHKTKMRSYRAC